MDKILIVDDEADIELLIRQHFRKAIREKQFDFVFAGNGVEALEVLDKHTDVNVILSDINMPRMDGLTLLNHLAEKEEIRRTVIISAYGDMKNIRTAMNRGAFDFLIKPIDLEDLELTLRRTIQEVSELKRSQSERLELIRELDNTQKEIIFTLGEVIEVRSKETGNHVRRVAEYSRLLAEKYGLDKEQAEIIRQSSPLHDIGKVAIPDSILNKPGKLTDTEFEEMKTHTTIGHQILQKSKRNILKMGAIISLEHHEKWNGKGYPRGLQSQDIHIFGRITAVADVFDALGSERVYKKAWPLDQIMDLFKKEKESHFDPDLVSILFDNLDDFIAIRDRYSDPVE